MFDRVPVFSEQWGEDFMETMRTYMGRLESSVDAESIEDGVVDEVETISGVPFCGCTECWEREAYLMAVKLTIEGYEAGLVKLADE